MNDNDWPPARATSRPPPLPPEFPDHDILEAAMRLIFGLGTRLPAVGPNEAKMYIRYVEHELGPYEKWPDVYKNPPRP